MIDFISLQKQTNLIKDVELYPLKINRDTSGILSEVLKNNWSDIFSNNRPFAQCYYSVTAAGDVRDRNEWHMHPTKQEDRFVIIRGDVVTAIYDSRPASPTYQTLNLFLMGEKNGDEGQYLLLIPKETLHGFAVVSDKEAVLLNFPTTIYDIKEEGRVAQATSGAKFADGSLFDWDKVINAYKKL